MAFIWSEHLMWSYHKYNDFEIVIRTDKKSASHRRSETGLLAHFQFARDPAWGVTKTKSPKVAAQPYGLTLPEPYRSKLLTVRKK